MSSLISTPAKPGVPPLQNGDHLSREEFHRRYLAMPHVKRAELINGVVYMPSPVRSTLHGTPHAILVTWAGLYCSQTLGIGFGIESTLKLEGDNEVQPDVLMKIETTHGGQTTLDAGGYILGGPELVGEIAASSVSIDRNTKMRAYRDSGVCEYVLWRTEDQEIDWFILRDGRYDPLSLTEGIFKSEVFPGLWLDPQALLREDLASVLATLQQGLASAEHAAFVQRLRDSAPASG